jgi:hypothetical protein
MLFFIIDTCQFDNESNFNLQINLKTTGSMKNIKDIFYTGTLNSLIILPWNRRSFPDGQENLSADRGAQVSYLYTYIKFVQFQYTP